MYTSADRIITVGKMRILLRIDIRILPVSTFAYPGTPENRRSPQDTADHQRTLLKTAGLQTKHRRTAV